MNCLHIFVFIASLVLALGFKHKRIATNPDQCPLTFPNGFYCSSICQKSSDNLKGHTMICFVSNDGDFHRFVIRNPAHGVWRFYKVDQVSDTDNICQTAAIGDEFASKNTEILCSRYAKTTTPEPLDGSTQAPSNSNGSDVVPDESESTNSTNTKRLSITDIVDNINEEIAKIFKNVIKIPGAKQHTTQTTTPSAFRTALSRYESRKNRTPPMDQMCHLFTTDIITRKTLLVCETPGKCCLATFKPEAIEPETLKSYECYKGISVAMDSLL